MANTKIPAELSSTPSIVDNGNANAITIDSSEFVSFTEGTKQGWSKKSYYGSGNEMEFYHDGSIGILKCFNYSNNGFQTRIDEIDFKSSDNTKTLAHFDEASSCDLYYNNAKKFETTTNGIDITGTVNLDNLTIAGAQGTDGQVLTSTGSGIAWEDASGGGGGGGVLSDGVMVTMHNNGTFQTILRNTTTKINFDYVIFGNSNNAFSTTNKEYTVPAAGKYLFLGKVRSQTFQTTQNGQHVGSVYIYKNGSLLPNYGTSQYSKTAGADIIKFNITINHVWDLAQNDVIDFRFTLSNAASTTNVNLEGNGQYTTNCYMYIVRIE